MTWQRLLMRESWKFVTLHFSGIRGVSDDWFSSCLSNRRQKVEVTSPNTAQFIFLWLGYTKTWSYARINSRASVDSVFKWLSPLNKFCNKTNIICWWYKCHNFINMRVSVRCLGLSSCSWRVRCVSCSLILKMKLVPPSLPRSSYVPSSFWFIL